MKLTRSIVRANRDGFGRSRIVRRKFSMEFFIFRRLVLAYTRVAPKIATMAGSKEQAVVRLQPKHHAARHFPRLERGHHMLVRGLDISQAPIERVPRVYRGASTADA
jgi:hypothetical protein